MQMPPGSANPSNRAATLTPSPKMSCSSTMTSPRFTPMRNLIRRSFGNLRLSGAHPALNLYSTPHSIDDTWKFREHAVAGIFDDPTSVLIDLRINQLAKVGLEAFVRPLLIRPHQPRIASHISGKDGSETAGRGHGRA